MIVNQQGDQKGTDRKTNEVIILGAGLAGLGAGYTLSQSNSGKDILIIEAGKTVGGLARTIQHNDFKFDLGGHRFKTSNKKTEQLIRQLMQDELLLVGRSSKILLQGKYFNYPLKPLNALFGFGLITVTKIIYDYVVEQIRKRFNKNKPIVSLEDWVVRNFGRTLFDIYFKQYSEKVWGIDCNRICMEWVEQRIQKLSLGKAIRRALFKSIGYKRNRERTLASEFLYPAQGIGRIAERLGEQFEKHNPVLTDSRIVRINHNGDEIVSVTTRTGLIISQSSSETSTYKGREFISSIPVATLVQLLDPKPPTDVLEAASKLKYRDLVIVTLMLNRERVTDQTWIYLPEKTIPFGRIHEPTNWSEQMAPAGKTLLVTEYFCFRGDETWSASDEALAEKTISHLVRLGFINADEVIDRVILRIPRAYPLFEIGYTEQHKKLCTYLERYKNLRLIGRGGMFKYYNMDHALESGIAAAEEILEKSTEGVTETNKEQDQTLSHTGTDA